MSTLILIPARKNSKGLPGKNIKILGNKHLIEYSLEFALAIKKNGDQVCVSTDDSSIISICHKLGMTVPFVRPDHLATDTASTFEVIDHALDFYQSANHFFDKLLLLQPTSPFRLKEDFSEIISLYEISQPDMVVSVKKSKYNPYFNLFVENEFGFIRKVFNDKLYFTRQECPSVYSYNGSFYLVNLKSYLNTRNFNFNKIIKYVMPESRSVDIDTPLDWHIAEFFLSAKYEDS